MTDLSLIVASIVPLLFALAVVVAVVRMATHYRSSRTYREEPQTDLEESDAGWESEDVESEPTQEERPTSSPTGHGRRARKPRKRSPDARRPAESPAPAETPAPADTGAAARLLQAGQRGADAVRLELANYIQVQRNALREQIQPLQNVYGATGGQRQFFVQTEVLREDVIEEVIASGHPGLIVPLADALDLSGPERTVARRMLTGLLETVDPLDPLLLHTGRLHRFLDTPRLRHEDDAPLLDSLLGAIQRAEDLKAVPSLLRLTADASLPAALRRRAEDCIEVLRKAEERVTLLRSTESPHDALLRPAQGAPESDPQQLLRPVDDEG